MVKKFFSAILVLILCLSLAACDLDDMLSGGSSTTLKYHELTIYVLNKDHRESMRILSSLAAGKEECSPEGEVTEENQSLEELYQYLDAKDYDKAAAFIYAQHVQVMGEKDKESWDPEFFTNIAGTWNWVIEDSKEDPNLHGALQIKDNGTVVYENETYFWAEDTLSRGSDGSRGATLLLYGGGVVRYYLDVQWLPGNSSYRAYLRAPESGVQLQYTMGSGSTGLNGYWKSLETDGGLEVSEVGVRLDNHYYNFEVITEEEGKTVANVYASGTKDVVYVLTLAKRDGYPVVTVKDAKGNTSLYYSEEAGYNKDWPEICYRDAMKLLDLWKLNNHTIQWNDKDYTREEAIEEVYTLLKKCEKYKDASSYLKRFTVKEDVLVCIENPEPNTANHAEYIYNEKGQLVQFNGSAFPLIEELTLSEVGYNDYYFTYDSKGRLSKITWDDHMFDGRQEPPVSKNVECSATYKYDSKGEVESINVVFAYGSYKITYWRDIDGWIREMRYNYTPCPEFADEVEETYFFREFMLDPICGNRMGESGWIQIGYPGNISSHALAYEFDEHTGSVVSKRLSLCPPNAGDNADTYVRIEYTYNSKGQVATEVIRKGAQHDPSLESVRTKVYTYDEAGKLIQIVETGDNMTVDKIEYNYIYKDLVFYNG